MFTLASARRCGAVAGWSAETGHGPARLVRRDRCHAGRGQRRHRAGTTLPRHRFLFGEKYDWVIVDDKDLEAWAYLATLPGARDTLIGNANTDGTAWMYAVAGLHPLWTHYDYPVQQGPGYHRVHLLGLRRRRRHRPARRRGGEGAQHPVRGDQHTGGRRFVMPDGLVSLDRSRSWEKIYDNGEARIYEWRGAEGMRGIWT